MTVRMSYAASDVAGQLVFTFIIAGYLPKFYTDVAGISAVAAGFIIGIARWIDAIDAPIWGIIFDKTRSRFGKSRPWFLWLCLPYAFFGVLVFAVPDIGEQGKIWYAGITYVICSIIYTGINTPVTSILSALTPNPQERVTLTAFRMFGSKLGVLIVNLSALPLVELLGGGDERRGYLLTLPIYAVGSVLLYLVAFRNLRETVPVEHKPQPILGTFGALRGNWPWIIIFISSLLFWIGFIARVTTVPYFFEYSLGRKDLVSTAFALDFVSLGTAFLLPWMCRWTSKRTAWAIGLVGMVVGQLVLHLGMRGEPSLAVVMTGWTLGFLFSGMAMAMPFSVLSESVDYGDWKTGIRAAGLLTAVGAAFCLKAGAGLGGAIPLWILDATGYVPNVAQAEPALAGIRLSIVWLPAICFALATIPVLFYGRFERLEPEIREELARRRAQAGG